MRTCQYCGNRCEGEFCSDECFDLYEKQELAYEEADHQVRAAKGD